jgi:hypothetical protein
VALISYQVARHTFGVLLEGYLNATQLYGTRSACRGKARDVSVLADCYTICSYRQCYSDGSARFPYDSSVPQPPPMGPFSERASTQKWTKAFELVDPIFLASAQHKIELGGAEEG